MTYRELRAEMHKMTDKQLNAPVLILSECGNYTTELEDVLIMDKEFIKTYDYFSNKDKGNPIAIVA